MFLISFAFDEVGHSIEIFAIKFPHISHYCLVEDIGSERSTKEGVFMISIDIQLRRKLELKLVSLSFRLVHELE